MDEERLDLRGLCERADVTPRTVRYYIQQGLLPPPTSSGPGAKYGRPHLDRLLLIKRLQQKYLPLAEIRARMDSLDEAGVRRAARQGGAGAGDALAYIRSVGQESSAGRPAAPALIAGAKPGGSAALRSQWERISLGPDVELHIRRPLSREDGRRVDKLIELVRQFVTGEEKK